MRAWEDQHGATAVEYALMVSLIAIAVAGTVLLLGESVQASFQSFVTEMGWS